MHYYDHSIGDFPEISNIPTLPMVYVLRTTDFEYIKVGISKSFKQRLTNIQSGCPLELFLWMAIRTPKPLEIESFIHKRMSHCNVRGEWFKPKSEDLDLLASFIDATNRHIRDVSRALL